MLAGPQSRVPVDDATGQPWSPQGSGFPPPEARPEEPWTEPDRRPLSFWWTLALLVVTVIGAIVIGSLLGLF